MKRLTRSLTWCELFHQGRWTVIRKRGLFRGWLMWCPICKKEREALDLPK